MPPTAISARRISLIEMSFLFTSPSASYSAPIMVLRDKVPNLYQSVCHRRRELPKNPQRHNLKDERPGYADDQPLNLSLRASGVWFHGHQLLGRGHPCWHSRFSSSSLRLRRPLTESQTVHLAFPSWSQCCQFSLTLPWFRRSPTLRWSQWQ